MPHLHGHRNLPSSASRVLRRITLLGLLFAGCAGVAMACYTTPRYHMVGVDQQIADARNVYLAKAVSVKPVSGSNASYGFVVLQTLAGAQRDSFNLTGRRHGAAAAPVSTDHGDKAFWQPGGGRLALDTDCEIHPNFVVGKHYLVFLDQPVSRRSFEEITVASNNKTSDQWLAYVIDKLGKHA